MEMRRIFRTSRCATIFALAAVLCAGLMSPASAADSYPDKPITLVVPFPPGAVTDRVARGLAVQLGKRLAVQVVVENLGGASGTLAGAKVIRAPADGYTLLLGTVNDMVLAPLVIKKAGYSVKDFTPVARLFSTPTIMVAHPAFVPNTAEQFAAYAKKQAEPIPLGATGMATLQTFGGVMFANAAGFKFTVIPYKGGGPLLTDLVGGQVQVATMALPSALPLLREGKLKSLGIISLQRDVTAPELATVNEGGAVKNVEADLWGGLAGPPGLPPAVVSKLSSAMRDILSDKAYKDAEAKAGNVLVEFSDPRAFGQFLKKEEDRLRDMASKVTVE